MTKSIKRYVLESSCDASGLRAGTRWIRAKDSNQRLKTPNKRQNVSCGKINYSGSKECLRVLDAVVFQPSSLPQVTSDVDSQVDNADQDPGTDDDGSSNGTDGSQQDWQVFFHRERALRQGCSIGQVDDLEGDRLERKSDVRLFLN